MAKIQLNSALSGLSGEIDGYVYRTYRGRTVVQRKPTFTQPWSEAQRATRATFGGGSAFAALVKADPELRALYAARGKRRKLNYRQMAIRDYFRPPTVDGLELARYAAKTGGILVAHASDDFEVVRVTLELRGADGAVGVSGEAVPREGGWHFPVPPPAEGAPPPACAVVTAFDRPGNATRREFPLP